MRSILALGMILAAAPAVALELSGPTLGVASNFGQGWLGRLFHVTTGAGVTDFRDAVYWSAVERDGAFVFETDETTWPDGLADRGAGMSLTVNNGHPAYDAGMTPHSPAAIAAFARATAEIATRFPAIHSVEVGNEFNAANFVTGPLAEGSLADRALGYLEILRATHSAVKAVDPDIRVLGGGLHSVPTGYLAPLMAAGAADYMDALALHPYTTPPEQFARQIEVLRRLPGLAEMPLQVTEFGDADATRAPHSLLKSYCAFALAGVSRATWYPLHDRGDGLAPLFTRDGRETEVGRAFLFLQTHLVGLPVRDISPDPFTQACAFGETALVIWGNPRTLRLEEGLRSYWATGDAAQPPVVTDKRPVLILGSGVVPVLGETVVLSDPLTPLLADTFAQFAYPGTDGAGFKPLARVRGREQPLELMPGQNRAATFWTPYLGLADDPGLRLTAEQMLPSGAGKRATEIVHRHTATEDMLASLLINLAPPERSADGVTLQVTLDEVILVDRIVTEAVTLAFPGLDMVPGTVLDIAVGPGATSDGDLVDYRFRLNRAR